MYIVTINVITIIYDLTIFLITYNHAYCYYHQFHVIKESICDFGKSDKSPEPKFLELINFLVFTLKSLVNFVNWLPDLVSVFKELKAWFQ